MEKRIIAVVCILLLLITLLSACGKKLIVTGDNGMEYVAVTDEEGNTVVNDYGDIVVYVTDEDGKYVKDENGERQTNVIAFPKKVVEGDAMETSAYKFVMPVKGWTPDSAGKYFKDGTENMVTLEIKNLGELDALQSLETVVAQVQESNELFMEEVKKIYPDSVVNISDVEITERKVPAKTVEFVIKDADGNMVYYAHGTFFICDGTLYKVEHICNDGQYYDAELDLLTLINEGLTIKGKTD